MHDRPRQSLDRDRRGGAPGWSAAAAALLAGAVVDATADSADGTFEIVKSDDEWRRLLKPAHYQVLRQHGTERPGIEPAQPREAQGHVRLRRLRPAAVLLRDQISKAAPAGRASTSRCRTRSAPRPTARCSWRAPRCIAAAAAAISAMCSRTGRADRPALLHERRGAEVRAGGGRRPDGAAHPAKSCRMPADPARPDPGQRSILISH